MKQCNKCRDHKEYHFFHKNKTKSDGFQGYCKACASVTNADTYKRLPGRRAKIRKSHTLNVEYCKKLVNRFKRYKGCHFCVESEPCALDFHHLDPTAKELSVSLLIYYSLSKVRLEIRKCAVLCANCHRKHHAGIPGYEL